MVRLLLKALLVLAGVGALAYGTFYVPIGQRTLWQHATRIAETDEARELGREVEAATAKATDDVKQRIDKLRD